MRILDAFLETDIPFQDSPWVDVQLFNSLALQIRHRPQALVSIEIDHRGAHPFRASEPCEVGYDIDAMSRVGLFACG